MSSRSDRGSGQAPVAAPRGPKRGRAETAETASRPPAADRTERGKP